MNKEKMEKLKKNLPAQAAIAIVVLILTFMLTTQMKTIGNSEEFLSGVRDADLKDTWLKLKDDYDNLKKKYDDSQKIVEEYKGETSNSNVLVANMKSELDNANKLAGLTDLKGEGLTVTLDDSKLNLPDVEKEILIIHDSDIATVVNELRAAGAEAISINDNRVISTTAIRCVGPVIQVNSRPVTTPITIKAIGNSQYLESALQIKGGLLDNLKKVGITAETKREKEIKIQKYSGVITMDTAQLDN